MKDWFRRQIETGFAGLQGLSIRATVPLKDKVINDALAELLQAPAAPSTGSLDLRSLLGLVKRIQVRSTEGAVVVDVEVGV
jgi:hypothetical protein